MHIMSAKYGYLNAHNIFYIKIKIIINIMLEILNNYYLIQQ